MKFIWFNPDKNLYQMGAADDYKLGRSISNNPEGFTLLYKLNATSSRLGEKLITELNKARKQDNSTANAVIAA